MVRSKSETSFPACQACFYTQKQTKGEAQRFCWECITLRFIHTPHWCVRFVLLHLKVVDLIYDVLFEFKVSLRLWLSARQKVINKASAIRSRWHFWVKEQKTGVESGERTCHSNTVRHFTRLCWQEAHRRCIKMFISWLAPTWSHFIFMIIQPLNRINTCVLDS